MIMRNHKKLFSILLCVLVPGVCFTQVLDSTVTKLTAPNKLKSYIIPAIFIGYGALSLSENNLIRHLDYSTHAELAEDHPTFALKLDNYAQYAPLVATYGLDFAGIKAKHDILDRSAMVLLSAIIMKASVSTLKGTSNRMRPNGYNNYSFPSGHTSTVFMMAEFLHQEYRDKSVWYSIAGYGIATGTGVFRMYNKAHWMSDVVAGAGFGILSTKLAYWIYPQIKQKFFNGKSVNLHTSPSFQQGITGLAFTYQFKR
jgi:membrane-associated phospholipid phosphatase